MSPPQYTETTGSENPFRGIDVGIDSAPTFADVDGDGDLDLIVGEDDGTLNYYRNDGSGGYTEATCNDNPFDGIEVGLFSAPTFADVDGDGDLDLIVGEEDGVLNYYENTASNEVRPEPEPLDIDSIDVGGDSTPTFTDVDGDGDLDLVVGEFDGNLNYYVNDGSGAYTETTCKDNPFDGIDTESNSAPAFADVDGDGDLDLVVGEDNGTLNYYRNDGSKTAPAYTEATGSENPFNGIDVGRASTPTFADVDGDGDLDLIVGEDDGYLNYYRNDGSKTAPAYTEATGSENPFYYIDVGHDSAPTFADVDGDGDLDLIVGVDDGTLNYYENTASNEGTS